MAKKRDIRKEPPVWCKDAIPSARGWLDPKTGELLVAIKLDMKQFDKPATKKVESISANEENTVKETASPKRRGGRRKKTEN